MKKGYRVVAMLALMLSFCGVQVHAQRVAVKTNALAWLTASPNVEAEFILGPHFSLSAGVAGNPIYTKKLKTNFWHFQPELRYWLNRPSVSHFFGLTAFSNNFKMRFNDVNHNGDAHAVGFTYGYSWVLGERWNLEVTAGVGVIHWRQFKYNEGAPAPSNTNDNKTMIAPVKLGVSFVYIIR